MKKVPIKKKENSWYARGHGRLKAFRLTTALKAKGIK
jgi:hypothetical protein